jgi:membrane protease YdiL (CAAX protease family)
VSRARLALVAGCVLLLGRPIAARLTGMPIAARVAIFVVVLAFGARSRPALGGVEAAARAPAALAVGVASFAIGWALLGGHHPRPWTVGAVTLDVLAAVAEEAFFRGLGYDVLERVGGAAPAIVGSALLFAAVHVSVYGLWVVPLDAAAGLLLGWQRWVTGRWEVPAATHAAANVLLRV